MALFLVTLPAGKTFMDGADAMIVSAADSANALIAANSRYGGDPDWATATVTTLADVASNAANALVGWTFRCIVTTTATGVIVADVTVTGDATNDTLDEIGTLLATGLNATSINNASYTAASQVLIVATGAGDVLGDRHVRMEIFPPAVTQPGGQMNKPVHHSGFVAGIVHQGAAGADLSVTFQADTFVVPRVLATLASR